MLIDEGHAIIKDTKTVVFFWIFSNVILMSTIQHNTFKMSNNFVKTNCIIILKYHIGIVMNLEIEITFQMNFSTEIDLELAKVY